MQTSHNLEGIPMTKTAVSAKTKKIDEARLETDTAYRFNYLAEVIGLSESDHNELRLHRATFEPHLPAIVERVYEKMFEYEPMKRHFLPRHAGFHGELPAQFEHLNLDHAQTTFRMEGLQDYLAKLCTAEWDETFAILIDVVGRMHTSKDGNSILQVPIVQITAFLGVINDLFLEKISELKLPTKTKVSLQRTYSKVFWIQNCMFIRHWVN